MDLNALDPTIIERLTRLEAEAAHATVMAAVAEHLAWRARQEADQKQAVLSEVKVWVTLLPDDVRLELLAPLTDSADPAKRLGVRLPAAVPPATDVRRRRGTPPTIPAPGPWATA